MNNGIMYQTAQTYGRVYEFTLISKPEDAQGSAGVYTWTPPTNCAFLEFLLIGGGGGGGAGARQALGGLRRGGGAGNSGAITWVICGRSFFTAALAITVGSGGAGGAAATADNTAAIGGTAGTTSIISMSGVQILGAAGGPGGQAAGVAGASATSGAVGTIFAPQSGASPTTAALSPATTTSGIPPGGGGGSATAANVYLSGTSISPHGGPFFYDRRYQGVLGVSTTYAGGGSCAAGVAGGAGADGLFYGQAGSGGGASDNGFASGKGGNGAGGYIRIVCF